MSTTRTWILGAVVALLATACATSNTPPPAAAPTGPLLGWTHERGSPDRMTDPEQRQLALELLRRHAPVQNAQIYGWGLPSPSPAPGIDDFTALDRRIEMMLSTGAMPVITLCCAPDWMKEDVPTSDAEARFEQPPSRQHLADFAALAARIAARYPQVHHFLVWNEFKGLWDSRLQRWDAERYTEMYNHVRRAIKAVRPDAQLGGPYIVMDSHRAGSPGAIEFGSEVAGPWGTIDRRSVQALLHWLAHHEGAEFIAVDGSVVPRDGRLDVSPVEALQKFVAVQRWIQQHTSLPIWWAEWYPVPPTMDEPAALQQIDTALRVMSSTPVALLLFWDPTCHPSPSYGRAACLWREQSGRLAPAGMGTRPARPGTRP